MKHKATIRSVALFMRKFETKDEAGFYIPESRIAEIKEALLSQYSNVVVAIEAPHGLPLLKIISTSMYLFYTCGIRADESSQDDTGASSDKTVTDNAADAPVINKPAKEPLYYYMTDLCNELNAMPMGRGLSANEVLEIMQRISKKAQNNQ